MDNSDNDNTNEWLISCRCESANAIAGLLSCLNRISTSLPSGRNNSDASQFRNRTARKALQPVTVVCSPTGLTFHAHGKSKQIQASIDLQSSWFTEYTILQESTKNSVSTVPQNWGSDWQSKGQFCINLTSVLECLQVIGSAGSGTSSSNNPINSVKLFMAYNRVEEYFKVELLQEDISLLVTAAIPSIMSPNCGDMEEDDYESYDQSALTLAFRSSPISARIIVKSDVLREVLSELEVASYGYSMTSTVSVSISKDYGLEFTLVGGILGNECWITVPTSGRHVVSIEFGPTASHNSTVGRLKLRRKQTYTVSGIIESLRVVNQLFAQETCITINSEGMIAIQHQIVDSSISDVPSFLDFIICSREEPDENLYDDAEHENITTTQDASAGLLSLSNRRPVTQGDEGNSIVNDDAASVQPDVSSQTKSSRRRFRISEENTQTDSDSDGSVQLFSETTKLFGNVFANGAETAESSTPSSPSKSEMDISNHFSARNVRPRLQRKSALIASIKNKNPESSKTKIVKNKLDEDDQSTSLLDGDDAEVKNHNFDYGSESEPLDITAPALPPASPPYDRVQTRENYDGDSSSPELVYGWQK